MIMYTLHRGRGRGRGSIEGRIAVGVQGGYSVSSCTCGGGCESSSRPQLMTTVPGSATR